MFLLDTDTISYFLSGDEAVAARWQSTSPRSVVVSAVTEGELWFGAKRIGSKKLVRGIEALLDRMSVLAFDRLAAQAYGELRTLLDARGTPIGTADTMIAAHALAARCTLVTGNTRHFRRVPGLTCEDWRRG